MPCLFRACKFKTNVYFSYNELKCREQKKSSDYDKSVVVQDAPQMFLKIVTLNMSQHFLMKMKQQMRVRNDQ